MRINYNEETNMYEIHGDGTLLLTKNEYGMKLDNLEKVSEDNVKLDVRYWYVIGIFNKGFIKKLKLLWKCFRFIFCK